MTATDYAEVELALWQGALQEQHQAEEELQQARHERQRSRVRELLPQVHALATRSDLLLAEAVRIKCMFRARAVHGEPIGSPQTDGGS
jgi:hypothetical protein